MLCTFRRHYLTSVTLVTHKVNVLTAYVLCYLADSCWCYRQCAAPVAPGRLLHQALAPERLSCSALTVHLHRWHCTRSRRTTHLINIRLQGKRGVGWLMSEKRFMHWSRPRTECLTGQSLVFVRMNHVRPGQDCRWQLSVCVVSAQGGPPSVSLQRRALDLWPCPQVEEQLLHGLQGS